ncbi:unnamed protein product, partial [Fusarium graminearum]
ALSSTTRLRLLISLSGIPLLVRTAASCGRAPVHVLVSLDPSPNLRQQLLVMESRHLRLFKPVWSRIVSHFTTSVLQLHARPFLNTGRSQWSSYSSGTQQLRRIAAVCGRTLMLVLLSN